MSKTGSLYAELWKDNQWEPILKPKRSKGKSLPARAISLGTQYELFAALIGYHPPKEDVNQNSGIDKR